MTENHQKDVNAISARVPDAQLQWLKSLLSVTNKPVIVFEHYGVADDNMKGNFWFEKDSHHAVLENRRELRQIFEASKKVKAVISAHQHWNKMIVCNEIPYFIVTSLIENFKNDGVPTGAYTLVDVNNNEIVVDVKGDDPATFRFRFK